MSYASDNGLATLFEMLSYKRPAHSIAEEEFIDAFIAPLNPSVDDFGNLWIEVGKGSRVLWSSHTDSVHMTEGRQTVRVKDGEFSALGSSCLGADCAVGVWLMTEMIKAGVPGVYVFHRCEEIGGQGSQFIAENSAHALEAFDYAIAFDRRGLTSVITHQMGRRGCSNAFAESLAPLLPGAYAPDETGVFTDTANYFDHIPECTNISVGYFGEHTRHETQDVAHALALRACLIKFDESKLVAKRVPAPAPIRLRDFSWSRYDELKPSSSRYCDMVSFIEDNAESVADLLEQMGFDLESLRREVDSPFNS